MGLNLCVSGNGDMVAEVFLFLGGSLRVDLCFVGFEIFGVVANVFRDVCDDTNRHSVAS